MAEMTERSFGYTCCPPPNHSCTPGHITTGDWMQYINAYMDVRARQIYEKLKGMIGTGGSDNITGDYLILKDQNNPNKKYKVFIVDGTICSEEL